MRKSLWDLHRDESGGPTTEYILVTAIVVIPFGIAANTALVMLKQYFFRCAEVVAMPFP